ncbi:flagellin [uncultured Desulfobacter sp.]|uniref:flagellin N-terminal helical domain-containing protein n=1 Tax=uncultured Desulfobacter sp. TaxID=240139 RepID=UPI0029F551ED|nr:flagellin [uncultured Desulfobacter sp.]
MSLSINTNVAALTAHRNMVSNDNDMRTSLTRLSTGLRINSAADDASGLTIADSLAAQADGIGQGIRNANDGVSIVQTADGALEESVSIVNTIKTKAIQAASDTQTTATRSAIQQDIDKLMEELDNIATTTSYNGLQLLNGTYTNKVIHTGASANETTSISIGDTESDSIGHISTATLALDGEVGSSVQLSITSAITGEDVELESITIEANNEEENGLGALADEINSVAALTGVSAMAIVETTTSGAIQEGTTGADFAINGVNIGAINVADNDADASLVTAINDKTSETGVSAALNNSGTITLTSEDGRVLDVTGETGGVFGDTISAADLSTVGYITLTQEGSSQFNINGAVSGGTGTEFVLDAEYTSTGTTIIADESKIASGSVLTAGTVLGGNATINGETDIVSDFQLEAGSKLASGSVIAQGTNITGDMTLDTSATLQEEMTVTAGSTLASNSVLGAGTVVNQAFTNAGMTYEAGSTLTANVTLGSSLIVTSDMELADDSKITSGSTMKAGTVLGADMTIDESMTLSSDMTLEAGSDIASGSVIAVGSTLGDSITLDSTMTTSDDMDVAAGSQIASASTIAKGSLMGGPVQVEEKQLEEEMTLSEGSTLASGSTILKGTTINQDIIGNTGTTFSAGTTLDVNVVLDDDVVLTEEMTLASGSTIKAGSILEIKASSEDVTISDQQGLTLADINVLTQEDAEIAIEIAEAALADLDAIRSGLGSVENQLSSTISNLSVTKTNVTASESTIRDVDFAEETANFARLSLLAQTGSYALSQANAASSNLTSLLQ